MPVPPPPRLPPRVPGVPPPPGSYKAANPGSLFTELMGPIKPKASKPPTVPDSLQDILNYNHKGRQLQYKNNVDDWLQDPQFLAEAQKLYAGIGLEMTMRTRTGQQQFARKIVKNLGDAFQYEGGNQLVPSTKAAVIQGLLSKVRSPNNKPDSFLNLAAPRLIRNRQAQDVETLRAWYMEFYHKGLQLWQRITTPLQELKPMLQDNTLFKKWNAGAVSRQLNTIMQGPSLQYPLPLIQGTPATKAFYDMHQIQGYWRNLKAASLLNIRTNKPAPPIQTDRAQVLTRAGQNISKTSMQLDNYMRAWLLVVARLQAAVKECDAAVAAMYKETGFVSQVDVNQYAYAKSAIDAITLTSPKTGVYAPELDLKSFVKAGGALVNAFNEATATTIAVHNIVTKTDRSAKAAQAKLNENAKAKALRNAVQAAAKAKWNKNADKVSRNITDLAVGRAIRANSNRKADAKTSNSAAVIQLFANARAKPAKNAVNISPKVVAQVAATTGVPAPQVRNIARKTGLTQAQKLTAIIALSMAGAGAGTYLTGPVGASPLTGAGPLAGTSPLTGARPMSTALVPLSGLQNMMVSTVPAPAIKTSKLGNLNIRNHTRPKPRSQGRNNSTRNNARNNYAGYAYGNAQQGYGPGLGVGLGGIGVAGAGGLAYLLKKQQQETRDLRAALQGQKAAVKGQSRALKQMEITGQPYRNRLRR